MLATTSGIRGRSTLEPDFNNFAPRVGLAYRLGDQTVIRAAYGIYHGGVTHVGDRYLHAGPPNFINSPISTDGVNPVIVLRDGLPPGATTSNVSNLQTISQGINNPTPYSQQWNFTIQRQVMRDLSVEIGYVGTKGNRLLQRFDGNAPEPGPGNINARRPFTQLDVPGVGLVTSLSDTFRREFSANSNYHSLQLKAEKRLSAGLSFLVSYTWSKAISDARGGAGAGGTSGVGAQNPHDLRAEKSLADEHFPHRFVASYNYDLPFGKGKRYFTGASRVVDAIVGGWALGGITTLTSGRRVNITVRGNPANTGSRNPNRPNATGNAPRLPKSQRTLARWFNTDAFVANDPFTFGSVSRNPVEAPGLVNFDFAAYKVFQITEVTRLQFRAEFFNALNTPHFDAPGRQLGTGQFGVISGAGSPRIIQFGLKFLF